MARNVDRAGVVLSGLISAGKHLYKRFADEKGHVPSTLMTTCTRIRTGIKSVLREFLRLCRETQRKRAMLKTTISIMTGNVYGLVVQYPIGKGRDGRLRF